MKKPVYPLSAKNKFWQLASISVGFIVLILAGVMVLFWKQLSAPEKIQVITIVKHYLTYIVMAFLILITSIVLVIDSIFKSYIIPIIWIAEDLSVMQTANPAHRIKIEGSKEILQLTRIINEGADYIQNIQKTIHQKIQIAKADAEKEKNMLAMFMSDLPQGVLICNIEGQILFYNRRIREYLSGEGSEAEGRFIGLGRSVFGVIDKNLIVHALDEISRKVKHKQQDIASYFVVVSKGGTFLRVEAMPVLNQEQQLTGFILTFFDITREIETGSRVDYMLQSLSRMIRTSLASIRAAIEAIIEYPDMNRNQLSKFNEIIHNETLRLSNILDQTAIDYSTHIKTNWPRVRIRVADLFKTIQRKADEKLKITVKIEMPEPEHWVEVDTYSIVLTMLFVISKLNKEIGCAEFLCRIGRIERFINIDFIWKGSSIRIETLRRWEEQPIVMEDEGIPLTMREVFSHHEAELWCYSCGESGEDSNSSLRFFLPAVEEPEPDAIRTMTIITESRPEFYDFDLFNRPGQTHELDNRLLSELSYTIFDTETTGLDPKTDEIISLGAVRIINGRLLRDEFIDQLVDPKCPIPTESIKIHGIQPEMLKGQPCIEKVISIFYRFSEDTILLGHNVAFDMRMLSMKEDKTGIKFTNPVLDTLLLSAVANPAQERHNMEVLSQRLGVSIVGRHTALGDAIATGEIFLKLIPLLAKIGVLTLKDAIEASQKTYYARIKY